MSWLLPKPPWLQYILVKNTELTVHMWKPEITIEWSDHCPTTDTSGVLYSLKTVIEQMDLTNEWEYLKRSSNPYELVFSQSQDARIPMSVSNIKPLSRSFFKMTEMLFLLNFFPRMKERGEKTIQSAHVCEGPGGFIESLIYESKRNSSTVKNAWAMTLKPTKSNIPGWKRANSFLRSSPMVHIEYGADDTGDIIVPENQANFLTKTRGKCNIFTADGGFDFSEHYTTQEYDVFPLLVSSTLIGLQTMVKGGDFILKLFDMEQKCTCDLVSILAYCFDEWTLYKPALSRPCNAEKYFVGKGCRTIPSWVIKTLVELRDTCSIGTKYCISALATIPPEILASIKGLSKVHLDNQIASLDYAIKHKQEWNADPKKIWLEIEKYSIGWCKEFNIPLR